MGPQTTQLLFFGVIIVVIVLLMFRNGRKRQRDQLALSEGLKVGAEIMTTFGVYGTIESIDDAENRIVLKTGPTSEMTIHRQAIGRVVVPVAADGRVLTEEPVLLDDAASDPEFGERIGTTEVAAPTPTPENPASAARPARGSDSGSSAL